MEENPIDEYILTADSDECRRLANLLALRQTQLGFDESFAQKQTKSPTPEEIGYVKKAYDWFCAEDGPEFDESKIMRTSRDFFVYCRYRDPSLGLLITITLLLQHGNKETQVRADVWEGRKLHQICF